MKRCPECRRDYYDDSLLYCLDDGSVLLDGPSADDAPTAILPSPDRPVMPEGSGVAVGDKPSCSLAEDTYKADQEGSPLTGAENSGRRKKWFIISGTVVLIAAGLIGYRYLGPVSSVRIESIAVMPFVNASGNTDIEYLSDGITESLINSLAKLPKLSVKSRSTVFAYKGKEVTPQQIAKDLSVQAVLHGRVLQRGEEVTLGLELIDAVTGNQIWGEQYNRQLTDLPALQSELTRDVLRKLGARLSGAEERRLAKDYTTNPEAYQLFLRGRFHRTQATRSELLRSVPLFQKAIDIDPNYTLGFVGLADAYLSLPLAGEMNPTEYFPKAKTAAQKALEIDDQLAEAHAVLGWIIYWYDWDWAAAEKYCRRAVELDPNSSEAQMAFAHVLSSTGRHEEAIFAARTARELEPLNIRLSALEAQFLIHAGRPDKAIDRLHKVLELDPNYWFAFQFLTSAYIDKGLYDDAVEAGRKGMEIYPGKTGNASFAACALAKVDKTKEARAVLANILAPMEGKFISPYNVAMMYNCLGETDEALTWLTRGFEQRDPRMTFLRAEPKWNNLRNEPRFDELLRRMGFPVHSLRLK